jgi:hypothetical protein
VKRLMRALLGAFWSLPLRFLTVPAMLYAGILAGGGAITADNFSDPAVILSGAVVGFVLRIVDNLTIEFAIFPTAMKIITKRGAE